MTPRLTDQDYALFLGIDLPKRVTHHGNLGIFRSITIGGLGDIHLKAIRFSEYTLEMKGAVSWLVPTFSESGMADWKNETNLTSEELLTSLLNLYESINNPGVSTESYTSLIAKWCINNVHPYAHDEIMCEVADREDTYSADADADGGDPMEYLLHEADIRDAQNEKRPQEAILITRLERAAAFRTETFLSDLHRLITALSTYLAIVALGEGDPEPARSLYYEGKLFDGPALFERIRIGAMEKPTVDDGIMHSFVNMFPSLVLEYRYDSQVGRIQLIHVANSVFDVCWYALGCMAGLINQENPVRGNMRIIRCEACNRYISAYGQQRYCQSPECQNARRNKKKQAYRARQKQGVKGTDEGTK